MTGAQTPDSGGQGAGVAATQLIPEKLEGGVGSRQGALEWFRSERGPVPWKAPLFWRYPVGSGRPLLSGSQVTKRLSAAA